MPAETSNRPTIIGLPPATAGAVPCRVTFQGSPNEQPYVVGIVYIRRGSVNLSQSVQMAPDARAAIDRMEGVVAEKWGAAAGHRVMASSFAIANHGDICRL